MFVLVGMTLTVDAHAQCDTVVSFVNFYSGHDIYELEGHSVIRIQMPQGDFAISYGTYDFEQPNFVYRFVKGETDYWVTALPMPFVEEYYRGAGRRIVEHKITMNSAQKKRLLELVQNNLLPENRTYRYNYVKDNCATRPLGLLEKALGDSIIVGDAPSELQGAQSFRDIMRYYHRNYPWYQFGIDLALGSGIDYPLDNREKSFAPIILDYQLVDATVTGRRLSETNIIINDVAPDAAVLAPTPWYLTPMTVSSLFCAVAILLTIVDIRRRHVSRWFDTLMYGIYGFVGCVIAFLVFISVHEATNPNINLIWLNPMCFIPAIFIWINRCKVIIFSYQIVNFVALIVVLVLAALNVQVLNQAFYPLILADAARALSYIYLNINYIKCRV